MLNMYHNKNCRLDIYKQLNLFLICIITTFYVIADDMSVMTLKNRFDKISDLYVHFVQKVNSIDGNVVEECTGELWIKRPNFFYWHMIFPEENFLISDGISLWFYIPSINQVIVYSAQIISDNIFLKIFSTEIMSICKHYDIYQKKDYFFLKLLRDDVDMQEYEIKITNCGLLKQCSVLEANGERIDYYLLKHNNNKIDVAHFFFNIPLGVQLDDQR